MLNAMSRKPRPPPGGGRNALVISRYHCPTGDPDQLAAVRYQRPTPSMHQSVAELGVGQLDDVEQDVDADERSR